jgi:signal transduction histidine kinase
VPRAWNRSQLVLGLLLLVALIPAASLAYLQFRSLKNARKQTHQALADTLQQGVIGARVEAETDLNGWPRMSLLGDNYHDWLEQGDLERIHNLSETVSRVCPYLSFFFAYQVNDRKEPTNVWIYRPTSVVRFMARSDRDSAEPAVRRLAAAIVPNKFHFYQFYEDIDGERYQVFFHLADKELPNGHGKMFGYYGFAVATRTLAERYFLRVLNGHLSRLATLLKVGEQDIAGWVVDENGRTVASTRPGAEGRFAVDEPLAAATGVLPGWRLRARFTRADLEGADDPAFLRGVWQSLGIAGLLLLAILTIGFTASREMQISRARSEFVASVSHELKTPIALIRGYVEALHSDRVRTEQQREEYFRIVESETLRLSAMIDQILESSKIEAGIKSYCPEPVSVAAVVEETVAVFSYEAEKAGVSISLGGMDAGVVARADAQSLSQAVLNLLSNAVKYSSRDRRISVSVERRGDQAAIVVADRGIGIPRAEQAKIFQKFYRVRSGTAPQADGAGLGLALVKHFAEAHGGAVTVDSEPDRGSVFTILLPCEAPQPTEVHV